MEVQSERPLRDAPQPPSYEAWPSVPTTTIDSMAKRDQTNTMDLDSVMSPSDRHSRATSTLSMDDIEAAHALEGLRADFAASPRPSTATSSMTATARGSDDIQQPEPLLSLLTSQHPLLSTAINGSLSAYTSSKSFSTRFRAGAEFVERNIASPVASTVGTAGRISGVETGVRWWLQRGDAHSNEDGGHKRRRIDGTDEADEKNIDPALAHRSRAASDMSTNESLPAYDDQRSPTYEEHNSLASRTVPRYEVQTPNLRKWQTRLMMSTSGLGVAMSEESLRSLKYCLSWLRWANGHLEKVLMSLQHVLEEWDQSQSASQPQSSSPSPAGESVRQRPPPRDQATITQHIQALKGECLQTLKSVVDIVSRYAGGALPENTRVLVRRHLTSLPQRFQIAASSGPVANGGSSVAPGAKAVAGGQNGAAPPGNSEKRIQQPVPEIVTGAQRVVVLAKEGLDMMAQVSGIVNGTIVSAEEWCDRLGRKRVRGEGEGEMEKIAAGEKRLRDGEGLVFYGDAPMVNGDGNRNINGNKDEDRDGSVARGEKEALVSAVGDMSMGRRVEGA